LTLLQLPCCGTVYSDLVGLGPLPTLYFTYAILIYILPTLYLIYILPTLYLIYILPTLCSDLVGLGTVEDVARGYEHLVGELAALPPGMRARQSLSGPPLRRVARGRGTMTLPPPPTSGRDSHGQASSSVLDGTAMGRWRGAVMGRWRGAVMGRWRGASARVMSWDESSRAGSGPDGNVMGRVMAGSRAG
jgi:hypothetical protein